MQFGAEKNSEHALETAPKKRQVFNLNIVISHVQMFCAFGISSSIYTACTFAEHTPLLALIEWVNPEDAGSDSVGQLSKRIGRAEKIDGTFDGHD